MKRKLLAICDAEQAYAYGLMDALSQRTEFPFELAAFSGTERLQECLARTPAELLLIPEAEFRPEMEGWGAAQILLLTEEEPSAGGEHPAICKYSSVTGIARKAVETAVTAGSLPPPVATEHPVHFYGIYTPVRRCLQTTFAFVLGQILARNQKVLYLNFEAYSGLDKMLGRTFEKDFSDLLVFGPEERGAFLEALYGMVESVGGMEIAPPAFTGTDLFQISPGEWQRLLDALQCGRYDIVLLDLSEGVQGLPEILRRCQRIYTIVREDSFAAAKLSQYEEMLRGAGDQEVLARTRKVRLPVFQKLPRDLNHLSFGELPSFVERMLERDEQSRV